MRDMSITSTMNTAINSSGNLRLMREEEYNSGKFDHLGTQEVYLGEVYRDCLIIGREKILFEFGADSEAECRKYKDMITEGKRRRELVMIHVQSCARPREGLARNDLALELIARAAPSGANRFDFVGISASVSPDEKGNVRMHFYRVV